MSTPSRSRPRRTGRSASASSPIPLDNRGTNGYFGVAGTNSTDDVDVLPVLSPEREAFLEYDLTRMVYNLAHPEKPVVAVLSSLPLNGDPAMQYQPWQVVKELGQFFDAALPGRRGREARRRRAHAAAGPAAEPLRQDPLRHRPVRDARRQGAGLRRPALRGAGDAPAPAAGHAAGRHQCQPARSCSRPGASSWRPTGSWPTRRRPGRCPIRAAAASRWSTTCPGSRSSTRA